MNINKALLLTFIGILNSDALSTEERFQYVCLPKENFVDDTKITHYSEVRKFDLIETNAQLNQKVADLKLQLKENSKLARDDISKLKSENTKLSSEIADLEAKSKSAEKEKSTLEKRLQAMQRDHETYEKKMQQALAQLSKQLETQKQINQKQQGKSAVTLCPKVVDLQKEINRLTEGNKDLRFSLKENQDELSKITALFNMTITENNKKIIAVLSEIYDSAITVLDEGSKYIKNLKLQCNQVLESDIEKKYRESHFKFRALFFIDKIMLGLNEKKILTEDQKEAIKLSKPIILIIAYQTYKEIDKLDEILMKVIDQMLDINHYILKITNKLPDYERKVIIANRDLIFVNVFLVKEDKPIESIIASVIDSFLMKDGDLFNLNEIKKFFNPQLNSLK